MHIPVLLKEVVEILNPVPGKFFIDGTIGGGGHAKEVIERISPNGIFLGIDWDKNAVENFKSNFTGGRKLKTIELVCGNYADLPEILKIKKLSKADGLIVDLGFSSEQTEKSGRGFSFLKNEPLDMRYETGSGKKETRMTAAEIINGFKERDLADIFFKYGGERYSRKIAKAITERRRKKRILTTSELVETIVSAVPKNYERGRIHPATRVFQALRICVNDELGNLERLLKSLNLILKSKGRAAIISFHSLEDRLVKNWFRRMVDGGEARILTKKPIRPTREEILLNPRSRSAKLRAIRYL